MIFVKNVPYLGLISCPCKQQTCIQYTNVRLTARAPRHLIAELKTNISLSRNEIRATYLEIISQHFNSSLRQDQKVATKSSR